jgi:ABC-type phosphate transport system auxiliary subunit
MLCDYIIYQTINTHLNLSLCLQVDEGNAEQQQEMEAELGKMQRKLQYMAGQLDAAKSNIEDLTVQLKVCFDHAHSVSHG